MLTCDAARRCRTPPTASTRVVARSVSVALDTYATDGDEAGLYAGTWNNRYPDVCRMSKFDIRINEKIYINITITDDIKSK